MPIMYHTFRDASTAHLSDEQFFVRRPQKQWCQRWNGGRTHGQQIAYAFRVTSPKIEHLAAHGLPAKHHGFRAVRLARLHTVLHFAAPYTCAKGDGSLELDVMVTLLPTHAFASLGWGSDGEIDRVYLTLRKRGVASRLRGFLFEAVSNSDGGAS